MLVRARMLNHPEYAERIEGAADPEATFTSEVAKQHRATSGALSPAMRLQLPWPRALGTAPWALAAAMIGPPACGVTGTVYATHWVLPGQRASAWKALQRAISTGHPTPIYIGSRWLPRHVILALDLSATDVAVYDPSTGHIVELSKDNWLQGDVQTAGWSSPWCVIVPEHSTPRTSSATGAAGAPA